MLRPWRDSYIAVGRRARFDAIVAAAVGVAAAAREIPSKTGGLWAQSVATMARVLLVRFASTTAMNDKEFDMLHAPTLFERVRGEFNEMPGLQLTIPQAARLWGLEHAACRNLIDALVEAAFLRWTPAGTVVRAQR